MRNKREEIISKKIEKFQKLVMHGQSLMEQKKLEDAEQCLQEVLLGGQLLDVIPFQGLGNKLEWQHLFPEGPKEWFLSLKKKEELLGNPFDLFAVCQTMLQEAKTKTFSQILKQLQNLSQKLGPRVQLEMSKAHLYFNNEQFIQALDIYKKILDKDSKNEKANEYAGKIYEIFEQNEKALQYSTKCLELNPENREALYIKAVCSEKNVSIITEEISKLAKMFPNFYRIHLKLGDLSQSMEKKLNYYHEALLLSKNSSYVLSKIGQAYLYAEEQKKSVFSAKNLINLIKKAQQYSEKALSCSQLCPEAYQLAGDLKIYYSNYEAALEFYKKSIEQYPNHYESYNKIAETYFLYQEDMPKAIEYFKKCLQFNPYHADIYTEIGVAYATLQDHEKEKQFYTKAIEVNPNHFDAIRNLALSERQSNRFNQALQLYARANQLNSSDRRSKFGLAYCYYSLDCNKEAKKWALKCIQQDDEYKLKALEVLSQIQLKNKNYQLALQWYLKLQNEKEQVNPSEIVENILHSITQQKSKMIIKLSILKTEKSRDNVYSLLQLAALSKKFKMIEESRELYAIVREMHEKQYISTEIKNVLNKQFESTKRKK